MDYLFNLKDYTSFFPEFLLKDYIQEGSSTAISIHRTLKPTDAGGSAIYYQKSEKIVNNKSDLLEEIILQDKFTKAKIKHFYSDDYDLVKPINVIMGFPRKTGHSVKLISDNKFNGVNDE